MFNPRPTMRFVPIHGSHRCVVVDDFLADPHALIEHAAQQRSQFAIDPDNFYPGLELGLGAPVTAALEQFFMQHVRAPLGARRLLHTSARLAMATLDGPALSGLQRVCHRDAVTLPDGEGVAACVAYLFDAPQMGGTGFYVATRPEAETAAYLRDVADGVIAPPIGYMTQSSPWFEQVCTVPAKLNRAIFYDGTMFHAAQIEDVQLLSDDPARGRLTLNGFFRFRQRAS